MNFPAVLFLLSSSQKRKAKNLQAKKKKTATANTPSLFLPEGLVKVGKTFFSFGQNQNIGWISSVLFLSFILFLLLSQKVFFQKKNLADSARVSGFEKLLPSPYPYPFDKGTYLVPEITANSVFILDADSAVILYEKNPNFRLPPASTTKMMTALVALDYYSLEDILTIGSQKVEGNSLKFLPGEKFSVRDLLYALLVASANDAALTLAENIPGGEAAFVEAMNKKAESLGLENTHFTNPAGFDDENHYSTARDLAIIARVLIRNPFLAEIVATPQISITEISSGKKYFFKNTNELVGKDGVKGIKTGWTQKAKECLVSWVEKEGRKIIIVLLESNDRFGETKKLIEWIFNNFEWRPVTLEKNASCSSSLDANQCLKSLSH